MVADIYSAHSMRQIVNLKAVNKLRHIYQHDFAVIFPIFYLKAA